MVKLLMEFLKKPSETGAIAPSSAGLSKLITDTAYLPSKRCVVELGSGTGVFTEDIMKKISPGCIFFSLEINPHFVEETRKKCPGAIVYHASAKEIGKYLSKHSQSACDCIISGLPWAAFHKEEQEELLQSIYDSLEEGGEFLTFAYLQGLLLPAGKQFKRLLKGKFGLVAMTKIVWKNMPPAFVYHCRK